MDPERRIRADNVADFDDAKLLELANHCASAAASIIRSAESGIRTLEWEEKSPADFVSEVDRAAEERIRALVHAALPQARLVGEELSPDAVVTHGDSPDGITFIVDPLDGTTNFLHGYPEYAVSIGVLRGGVPAAGVVLNVATGEHFTALRGEGAWRNGERIAVSTIETPSRALVGTGFPFKHPEMLPDYLGQFSRVMTATSGIRRAGSAALDLADVACGRFDAFWELRLAPWDFAAGMLLVREAGGRVTNLAGVDAPVEHGPIVAGNHVMHQWLLKTLDSARSG
jgi:myo-inositol-1(or 4)-monophosphatase